MKSNTIKNSQLLHQKIKSVLMKDWDPIGVEAIPEADDEYDGYVPTVYAMLISRKPLDEVYKHLIWLEAEHMGLIVNHQRTLNAAEKLIELTVFLED